MDLQFSHVDILVADLKAAADYYRNILGFNASEKQVWQRGEFHVEFAVMFKDRERFMLVQPIGGNLKALLDQKGTGTIYRYCFTTDDIGECYRELLAKGVQPEDENGVALSEDQLDSPAGTRIIWLPKVFGDLSMEVLERHTMEANMRRLQASAG